MAPKADYAPEPFRINFASGGHTTRRAIVGALYGIATIGLVLAIQLVLWTSENREEAKQLIENFNRVEAQATRLRNELSQAGFVPDDASAVGRLENQVDGLNRVLESKAFSWTGLLNDLESVVTRRVSINSIRPELKTKLLTFDGIALTLQDVTELMTELQKNRRFTDVFLKRQTATDNNRTEFTIECVYDGGRER